MDNNTTKLHITGSTLASKSVQIALNYKSIVYESVENSE